jgi:phage baseplate assembly protein W
MAHMQLNFYSLPFNPGDLLSKEEYPKCSLQQSVAQHLHLLLTTAYGEFACKEDFGCCIWEYDFDHATKAFTLKETIKQSVSQAIKKEEQRLSNVFVDLQMYQEELPLGGKSRVAKKRMDITISGLLQMTNETFTYKTRFYIGPLSY